MPMKWSSLAVQLEAWAPTFMLTMSPVLSLNRQSFKLWQMLGMLYQQYICDSNLSIHIPAWSTFSCMVMLFIAIMISPTAVFKMQNSTGGVNQKCIEAYSSTNETWKCLSIPYAEPFTTTRLFALNSIYDSWQLANILQIPCKPPDCDSRYMEAVENYGKVRFSVLMIAFNFYLASLFLHLRITFCLCMHS